VRGKEYSLFVFPLTLHLLLLWVCLFIFTPTYASPLKGEESIRGVGSFLKGEEVPAAPATRGVGSFLKGEVAFRVLPPMEGEDR